MAFKVGRCLLQKRLNQLGLTQQQLSDRINMPKQQVSDYATNRRRMSIETARTISSALKCKIEDLYEWVER
jgi:transcriptional regulator with XRE-family HTH domain